MYIIYIYEMCFWLENYDTFVWYNKIMIIKILIYIYINILERNSGNVFVYDIINEKNNSAIIGLIIIIKL